MNDDTTGTSGSDEDAVKKGELAAANERAGQATEVIKPQVAADGERVAADRARVDSDAISPGTSDQD